MRIIAGAWLIHRYARDHDASVTGLDSNGQQLFDQVHLPYRILLLAKLLKGVHW